MTKDIEWLKEEIGKLPCVDAVFNSDGLIYVDSSVPVMPVYDLINEVEQGIVELVKELNELDSQLLELETNYYEELSSFENELVQSDSKIKELEYDLFIEKTKDSEHKFYWFTAKRTPFVADVIYTDKEKHLYGFKQVPNYHFIEKHDLRFKTHSSLDDLIEELK